MFFLASEHGLSCWFGLVVWMLLQTQSYDQRKTQKIDQLDKPPMKISKEEKTHGQTDRRTDRQAGRQAGQARPGQARQTDRNMIFKGSLVAKVPSYEDLTSQQSSSSE